MPNVVAFKASLYAFKREVNEEEVLPALSSNLESALSKRLMPFSIKSNVSATASFTSFAASLAAFAASLTALLVAEPPEYLYCFVRTLSISSCAFSCDSVL